jgi:ferritin-like metal-binding protein YciE
MAELNARDAKLVQFLNEAHAKEAELEADLTAHIALTQKAPYKKRLQQHLRETKDHKKRVAQRIKQLGGSPAAGVRAPGVPDAAGEVVGKAIAALKGQVGVARAALTEQAETHLRNAREELREEYVEIGTYTAIEAFATEVGDRETAQLAKTIQRDEQKTADYLERLIPQLVKDVVKAEIPRDQRPQGRRRGSSTGARRTSTRTRATSGRSRSTASRSRSAAGSTARKAGSTARRTTKAATTGARAGAKAAGTAAKRSAAGSRGGSSSRSSNGRSTSSRSTSANGRSTSRSRKAATRS